MTAAELLAELAARGIEIEVDGGRLRIDAPPGAMAEWLHAALVEHRRALLAFLEAETDTAETAPAAPPDSVAGDVSASSPLPVSTSPSLPIGPESTLRIPLDDLVRGDFLEQHRLRIVGGTAYPDGRTYRPTIYLAGDRG